jgi:hypothetical protein
VRPARIAALVIGCLLVIPALSLLVGGTALGLGYAFGRGDDGYFDTTLDRLATDSVAITADDITFATEPGSPDWILDALDADVRLRATNAETNGDVFIGIGRGASVDAYLAGIAHDEIIDLDDDLDPVYRRQPGSTVVVPPTEQDFWAASASGSGTQELEWEATSGNWSAVVMNADGSPAVIVDVNVGARAAFILPLTILMLGTGVVLTAIAVALIIVGARDANRPSDRGPSAPPEFAVQPAPPASEGHPVTLSGRLEPDLSRWLWLVKWFLAIPHLIILALLWLAFVVLTVVAGIAIVFTGRYPRGIFDFNVGVMRWTWRVTHYATTGGIGTDRYPPFSLSPEAGEAASLDIAYPERLRRWGPFVKWFLAIPHLVIVSLLAGGSVLWIGNDRFGPDITGGGGLLGVLVLVAGVFLLFTDRYPEPLFDLIVGLNRWSYRTIAYVALMTDTYPPFRLDQGGREPSDGGPPDVAPPPPAPAEPMATA